MATTGTVVYEQLNVGNNSIVGTGAYTNYNLVKSSGSFPSGAYTITSATLTYTIRSGNASWNNFLVYNNSTNEYLGTCGTAGNSGEFTQALGSGANYSNLPGIILKGDGGSAGQIESNTPIYVTVNWKLSQTNPTAPTSISASPNPFDTSVVFTWNGAKDGINNPITNYYIVIYCSTNGGNSYSTIGERAVNGTSFTYDTSALASQTMLYATIAAVGQKSWSDTKACNPVTKITITAPTAPTAGTADYPIFEDSVTIGWSGQAPGSNNAITGYTVQYAFSTDYTTIYTSDTTTASLTINTVSVARGALLRFRVLTKGTRSNSDYSSYFTGFKKNYLPPAPTIIYPTAGKTTYNQKPKIKGTVGIEPDGQKQALIAASGSCSAATAQELTDNSSATLVFSSQLPIGSNSITLKASDGLASADAAAININIADTAWTDALVALKAIHINELRTAINNIRNYYGLDNYSWAETIAVGTKCKASHINEMIDAINATGAVSTILTKVKQNARIKVQDIQQLRNVISEV